jgi:hypothetical protein
MKADFEVILEDSLVRLRTGASIEECPLLLVTSRVRKIARPQARPQAVQAGLERILVAVPAKKPTGAISTQPISKTGYPRYIERIFTTLRTIIIGKENAGMKLALRLAIDLVVILVIGGLLTVNASARSLPGDSLYGVKRTWEDVRLSLTLNSQAKQQYQNNLSAQRLQEVQQLVQLRRPAIVEFEGTLQSISVDEWVIDAIHVKMQSGTIVEGNPAPGMYVWIRAQIQSDGSLVALLARVMNQNQPGFPYQRPGQTPQRTPMPSSSPWPMHQPTYMPQSTRQPNHMPSSTYQPHEQATPTYGWDNNNNWHHHDMGGGSGMNHHMH